jgi:pimeloyl-ACP methyl ester carboxylesterase
MSAKSRFGYSSNLQNKIKNMFRYLQILLATSLIFAACKKENKLNKSGEMLFLKHKGASMPILVRGNFDSDVILLVVHGGAGGSSGSHIEDFKNFIEPKYLVAYWDQRHAGASQGNFDKADLTIDLMAEDMLLTIRLLKHKYGSNKKIFAFGHSWGVILSTYYLITQPNELQGIILSNGSHSTIHEYSARIDYVKNYATEMINKGIQMPKTIKSQGLTFENLQQIVDWCNASDPVENYNELTILYDLVPAVKGYVDETYVQATDIPSGISNNELYFQSPYNPITALINLNQTKNLINNLDNQKSIQEFYDFTPEMKKISLPVALYYGRYDDIIGPEVALDYYQVISTPADKKELFFFEKSNHSPQYIENVLFSQKVTDFIEKHKK